MELKGSGSRRLEAVMQRWESLWITPKPSTGFLCLALSLPAKNMGDLRCNSSIFWVNKALSSRCRVPTALLRLSKTEHGGSIGGESQLPRLLKLSQLLLLLSSRELFTFGPFMKLEQTAPWVGADLWRWTAVLQSTVRVCAGLTALWERFLGMLQDWTVLCGGSAWGRTRQSASVCLALDLVNGTGVSWACGEYWNWAWGSWTVVWALWALCLPTGSASQWVLVGWPLSCSSFTRHFRSVSGLSLEPITHVIQLDDSPTRPELFTATRAKTPAFASRGS